MPFTFSPFLYSVINVHVADELYYSLRIKAKTIPVYYNRSANLHLLLICPYHKQLFPSDLEYHLDISPSIEITLTNLPHSIHHPITMMKDLSKKVTFIENNLTQWKCLQYSI